MNLNDLIKEAEYADIILSLLSEPYEINSVTKMIFFSFCIRYEENFASYRKRSRDFVDVFFENISLKLDVNYKDLERIMNVLRMLEKTRKIAINKDSIQILEEFSYNTENEFIKMCNGKTPNPILEINKLDATAVIEEVIRYV